MRTLIAALALLFAVGLAQPLRAAQTDPAAQRVEAFHAVLLETMKGAKALGPLGRYRKLTPAVTSAFDLGSMTRFAVGPPWAQMTPAQQQSLTQAFTRLSIANYAHNFDGWSGESFVTDGVQTRGVDKVVWLGNSGGGSLGGFYQAQAKGS